VIVKFLYRGRIFDGMEGTIVWFCFSRNASGPPALVPAGLVEAWASAAIAIEGARLDERPMRTANAAASNDSTERLFSCLLISVSISSFD
jgi:hypothetical protein